MAVGMKNYYIAEGAIRDTDYIKKYLNERNLKITEESFKNCQEIQNIIKNFRFLAARGAIVLCSGSADEDSIYRFVEKHFTKYNEELAELKGASPKNLASECS